MQRSRRRFECRGSVLIAFALSLLILQPCLSSPSDGFYESEGDIFDSWGVCRTRAYGEDGFFEAGDEGFRPAIAFESLGSNAEEAYSAGAEFADRIDDPNRLAEAIFAYVRNGMTYTSDTDQFGYRDFAQNADELIRSYQSNRRARGDCEDFAILLAVMWRAAGLRSAIVLTPDHAAALVYLPDYPQANVVWELGGERGWIWGEATGSTNPLGWTPERHMDEDLLAYEVSDDPEEAPEMPETPPGTHTEFPSEGGSMLIRLSPFVTIVIIIWVASSVARTLGLE
jgi:hypothetical protein